MYYLKAHLKRSLYVLFSFYLVVLIPHANADLTTEGANWANQTRDAKISVGVLPGYDGNIFDFLNKIIRSSVSISLTLAVLMLVLAGFSAVQAKDSAKEDYFTKVRNVSTGIAIILLSYLIIAALFSLFFSL